MSCALWRRWPASRGVVGFRFGGGDLRLQLLLAARRAWPVGALGGLFQLSNATLVRAASWVCASFRRFSIEIIDARGAFLRHLGNALLGAKGTR